MKNFEAIALEIKRKFVSGFVVNKKAILFIFFLSIILIVLLFSVVVYVSKISHTNILIILNRGASQAQHDTTAAR